MVRVIEPQADSDGNFRRQNAQYRSKIAPGTQFPPEKGRYLLYVCLLCPWACRALIMRKLKGLEDVIEVSVTYWILVGKDYGWEFKPEEPGCTSDPVLDAKYTADIYHHDDPNYDLRYTVPILFDKQSKKIVNNESSEIIRILDSAFDEFITDEQKRTTRYYPNDLKIREKIDEVNEFVYHDINNGVYKTGFATEQAVYDINVKTLFVALDRVEGILKQNRYLTGDLLTEADIRLFTTIVRFDFAYHTAFKCNYKSIRHDYPNINRWLKELYWSKEYPAFRESTNFDHIKGYYKYSEALAVGPKDPVEKV